MIHMEGCCKNILGTDSSHSVPLAWLTLTDHRMSNRPWTYYENHCISRMAGAVLTRSVKGLQYHFLPHLTNIKLNGICLWLGSAVRGDTFEIPKYNTIGNCSSCIVSPWRLLPGCRKSSNVSISNGRKRIQSFSHIESHYYLTRICWWYSATLFFLSSHDAWNTNYTKQTLHQAAAVCRADERRPILQSLGRFRPDWMTKTSTTITDKSFLVPADQILGSMKLLVY